MCEPLDLAKIQWSVDTTYNIPYDHRDFRIWRDMERELDWAYKIKYSDWVLSRFFFLGLCIALEYLYDFQQGFYSSTKLEIVGCQNLLILCSIHNGCLYIIGPKRRTSFSFMYSFSSGNYAI